MLSYILFSLGWIITGVILNWGNPKAMIVNFLVLVIGLCIHYLLIKGK